MLSSLATGMDDATVKTISDLENGLGKTLLAFRCHELKPTTLTDDELGKIQAAEKKIGVSLIAVEG